VEETSTQVELGFAAALQAEGLSGRIDPSRNPTMLADRTRSCIAESDTRQSAGGTCLWSVYIGLSYATHAVRRLVDCGYNNMLCAFEQPTTATDDPIGFTTRTPLQPPVAAAGFPLICRLEG